MIIGKSFMVMGKSNIRELSVVHGTNRLDVLGMK
jgi:hypothetical protein